MKLHRASHLDIIVYSREQILLEHAAMNDTSEVPDAPWGVVRFGFCLHVRTEH